MATFYGTTAYGNGTARYRLELEVTQSSTHAGTVTAYWVAVADVVNGYNFSNGNSFSITVNGASLYSSSNVGTIKCQSTGTRTQIWSGSWSVGSSVTEATFAATFRQTQATQYSSSVNGTLTFGATAPIGYLDEVTPTLVKGWCAVAGSNTRYAVSVNVFDSNWNLILPYVKGTADIYREDLETAGYGDGKHGFEIPLDFAVEYGAGTYYIQVYAIYNSEQSTTKLTNDKSINISNRVCVWNGETWKSGEIYVYSGSTWKKGSSTKVYNGSTWK